MPDPERERRRIGRLTSEIRRAFGRQLRDDRIDASLTQTSLAKAAGISRSHLCGIEAGASEASLTVMSSLADALGSELVVRMRPGTGPRIRDGIQARIAEELIRIAHARWQRFLEVPVHQPARGLIDLVFHDLTAAVMLATEIHSQLRRLEQLLRWANLKRESLPSSDMWSMAAHLSRPTTSGLLVIRSTQENRDVAERFRLQLASAYPARASDAYRALTTGDGAWPGAAILWAKVVGDSVRILDRPPRGMTLGS